MRLIIDTNILLYASSFKLEEDESEQRKQDDCSEFIKRLLLPDCIHEIVYSQDISNEYYNSKQRERHPKSKSFIADFQKKLGNKRYQYCIEEKLSEDDYAFLNQVKFDPDDIKFVELAVSEKITLIVSEDSGDYAPIKAYLAEKFNLEVLTAREAIGKIF
jgi:predicted nucleic acid-binding protein